MDVFSESISSSTRQSFLSRLEEAVSAAIALSVNVVDIAEASGRQNLLVILLPLFCDLLYIPDTSDNANDNTDGTGMVALRRMLHRLALKNLLALGSRYPVEFRHVVAKVATLKPRIEAAARMSTVASTGAASGGPISMKKAPTSALQHQQQPKAAIKLKMEFSNFT